MHVYAQTNAATYARQQEHPGPANALGHYGLSRFLIPPKTRCGVVEKTVFAGSPFTPGCRNNNLGTFMRFR